MDSIVVPMRCSVSGRPFRARFERAGADAPYALAEVLHGTSLRLSGGSKARPAPSHAHHSGAGAPDRDTVGFGDLRWSGLVCPDCGYGERPFEGGIMECGACQSLMCGGGVTYDGGKTTFKCGNCGSAGRIGDGAIDRVRATRPGLPPRQLGSGTRGLLGGVRKLLGRGNPE